MQTSGTDKELAGIILKSAYTSLSAAEEAQLTAYLNASEANRAKYKELTNAQQLQQKLDRYYSEDGNKERHFQHIVKEIRQPATVHALTTRSKRVWVVAAAALVLLVAGAGALLYTGIRPRAIAPVAVTSKQATDVLPGKDGAVLTLADGAVVMLDSLKNGVVASEMGSKAVLQNGQLAYTATGEITNAIRYNTLSTPRGRQFKVVLPDGTQVWLNSASSIRYPMLFTEKERTVTVTGEAYLEVAADESHPFIVQAGHQAAIEVLGTHFNINSYEDEEMARTTLLAGAVRTGITSAEPGRRFKKSVVLSPGQQAQMKAGRCKDAACIKTSTPDIDQVMAWHRGLFNFEDADLQQVMRQLARWYDLEVVYEAGVPPISFTGELSRSMNLSVVLGALQDSKVHFKIEGKQIIIRP